MIKTISSLVTKIKNIIDLIIVWYLFFSETKASFSLHLKSDINFFIKILMRLALFR